MRNLKKVIALVAVFAMLVSTVAFAGSYTDVADTDNYAEAIEMLSSLNILTGDKDADGNAVFRPNDSITRAEVATIVERIQNINNVAPTATQFTDVPAEHWASGYIAQAAGQGIINGYGDGTFGPEDNVLYEQAVKMLVETLGYAPFVEANGGYYAGHLLAASRYGILDGVKGAAPGQEATRGQVAQLVYNAIETPIMERSAFGTEEKFEIFDGGKDGKDEFITLLTRDLGVVKGTGVIASNNYEDGIDTTEDMTVAIAMDEESKEFNCYFDADSDDDLTFIIGDTDAAEYVGLEVSFYAEEGKSDEYTLISVAPTAKNKSASVALADVIGFDEDGVFEYYNDKNKVEDNIKIGAADEDYGYICIYNGVVSAVKNDAEAAIAWFEGIYEEGLNGQITFIDNGTGRGYTVLSLEVATSAVVDEVDGTEVIFKNSADSLDFDADIEDAIIKLTKNGAPVDYTTLTEWDVLSILYADGANYAVAEVIDGGKITGSVEEVSGDEYKIAGQWYEIAGDVYGSTIKPGSEGTFYVDKYGMVIAYDKAATTSGVASDKYAYILNATTTVDEWENESVRIQWLDKAGEIGDTYLADKFTLENIGVELEEALEDPSVEIYEEDNDDYSYTYAKIDMEDFANTDKVDVLVDTLKGKFVTYALSGDNIKTITLPMVSEDEDIDMLKLAASDNEASYDEEDKEITVDGKTYDVTDDTIVFYLSTGTADLISAATPASKYYSSVATAATLATFVDTKAEVYNVENDVPAVVVLYNTTGEVSPSTNIAVIESVGKATVAGEQVTSITYWMNGEKATAYNNPEVSTNPLEDVKAGEIYQLKVDGTTVVKANPIATGYKRNAGISGITEKEVDGEVIEIENGIVDLTVAANANGRTTKFGPVVEVKNGKIILEDGTAKAGSANIYVVEEVRGKLVVSTGSLSDVTANKQKVLTDAIEKNLPIQNKVDGVWTDLVEAGEMPYGLMNYATIVEYDGDAIDIVVYAIDGAYADYSLRVVE